MATWLNDYQAMKVNMEQELAQGAMETCKAMQYQELLYRIEVLETCRMLCKTAPVTMEMKTMIEHYQLVDAYIQCISVERRFGMPADEKQKACRKTAVTALEKTVTDCRKRFSSFRPTEQEQYRRSIVTFINTVLPVWLQFRNTYTPINK